MESGRRGEGGDLAPNLAGGIGKTQEGRGPETEDAHPRKMEEGRAQGILYNRCPVVTRSASSVRFGI